MFKKLVELIKSALHKMAETSPDFVLTDVDSLIVSEDMQNAIDLWRDMYKDESPWVSEYDGIYSLGLAKVVCQLMQMTVLSEIKTSISEPDKAPIDLTEYNTDEIFKNRANYLNYIYQNRLINKLPQNLEKGMALGGMIIKPYTSNNEIYFDFITQGDFLPLEFDDDGNITDIAFIDQFISGNQQFSKVERQVFRNKTITITNNAFVAPLNSANTIDNQVQLGKQIPLSSVPRWSTLSEDAVVIKDVSKPLYGYYRVPTANNIDLHSPLGVSIFSSAVDTIHRADEQFSRLDWEYNGGQIAIDVDVTAVKPPENELLKQLTLDSTTNRLYRKLDLGSEDTYNAFAPVLRDNSYRAGLNSYLNRIEDQCGLARGTLGDTTAEARTATEISIIKQRSYVTASSNQDSLELAMKDAIKAANVYASLYNIVKDGKYVVNIEWQDNILTDTRTDLEQKLMLKDANILSAAEIRAWYTGEDIEVAKTMIDNINKENESKMLNDIYTQTNEDTLEDSGEEETTVSKTTEQNEGDNK